MLKNSKLIIVILLLFFTPVYLRTFYESYESLNQHKTAIDYKTSVEYLESASSWRSPGNIYAYQADSILSTYVVDTSKSDADRALAARALYQSLMKSRNVLEDTTLRRAKLKQQIIKLDINTDKPLYKRVNNREVNYTYQILAQIFFWSWILAILSFVFWGFNKEGQIQMKSSIISFFSALLLFVLWMTCIGAA